ncbi:MAG TPA: LysM peptidoglycan-binding domain-containing protein [Puia sp.]|jgi:LysM repeat protein|nr:LysM peptidoglycan-binding domain-containing protein [Puia sp.]
MRLHAPVLLVISCLIVKLGWSQSDELIVRGQTGKLYLEHTVVAKENWYSVGRLYNINPKELATYNHLTFAQPLEIGQALQVPLTAVNFSQNGKKLAAETLIPVIHVVQEKEWLYRISINHDKVPIPLLEKWNHVTGDEVHPGLHLIVGYLKVKTALSALATEGNAPAVASTSGKAPVVAPATGGKLPEVAAVGAGGKAAGAVGTSASSDSAAAMLSSYDTGAAKPAAGGTAGTGGMQHPAVSVTPHPTAAVPQHSGTTGSAVAPVSSAPAAPHFNGGKFRSEFSDGGKSVSGPAGIFKSTSGWQDGKYYALINTVPVGTIVKISDPATGKSIYAKVLGQLPDMKESAGLTIRVSEAAAAELGEKEAKFGVGVNY